MVAAWFTVLLIGVLIASVVYFAVMGLVQRGRTRRLARTAHEMNMHFSADDPFDVPRRYAGFALLAAGHSLRASNVTYGRLDGTPVRAFDFRHELGHGTRRITEHYGVIVAETDVPVRPVLMWHERDAEAAPLAARDSQRRIGCWRLVGDEAFGSFLSEACGPLAADDASIQTYGTAVMVCVPIRRRQQEYANRLGDVLAIVRRIGSSAGGGG